MTSVTNALPSLNKIPAMAGKSAKASGAECQWDSSVAIGSSLCLPTRGRKISSVEERIEFLASEMVSDSVELRRSGQSGMASSVERVGRPRRRRLALDKLRGGNPGD